MRVYFDSSALAKRYIEETGTAEVLDWCERADELALSVIAIPELISAFCRLHREARLDDGQYQGIKRDLLTDIEDALICETTAEVVQHAVRALEAHPLRGMDAIHIGAALVCGADVFLSADTRQCQAAAGLGIQVVAL
jgi:Predicted nucleic acid-binding protein, contains PIN domain